MKHLLFLLLILPLQSHAGRTWTLTVHVINDSTDLPVADAQVTLGDENRTVRTTNTEGVATFEGINTESVLFYIAKEGYYEAEGVEYSHKRKSDRNATIRLIQTTGPNVPMRLRNRMRLSRAKYEAVRISEMKQLELKLAQIDTNAIASCMKSSADPVTEILYSATFPGGIGEMQKFIMHNLNYPVQAIEHDERGTVYVTFIIDKDGSITNVNVARGVSRVLDAEAVRVISGMPKWIPGYCNGRPLKTRSTLPIIFTLN